MGDFMKGCRDGGVCRPSSASSPLLATCVATSEKSVGQFSELATCEATSEKSPTVGQLSASGYVRSDFGEVADCRPALRFWLRA